MATVADRTSETRRHLLAVLARELELRGVRCRVVGDRDGVLHAVRPASERSTMVVAMQSFPRRWSYLWTGGGLADAADPGRAADRIAACLD